MLCIYIPYIILFISKCLIYNPLHSEIAGLQQGFENPRAQVDLVGARWQKMLADQTAKIDKHRGHSSEVRPPPVGAREHADDFTSRHLGNFL
jgi:hypothetical protein